MRVAVDISPIKTGHGVRGIGSYTEKLIREFKKGNWPVEFEFFEDPMSPPPADLVHYPYFDLFFHTLSSKKTCGRVVTIHDVIPLVFPSYFPVGLRGYLTLFFQKRALKNVNAIICDSQTSKNDIISKLTVPEWKIHVVYLAPGDNFKLLNDQKSLSQLSKKYNLPERFILYVGDVNWNKNIPNLLEAAKISKINLVMVGKALTDQSLEETKEINRLIKKLKIENKIMKIGYVPEEVLVAIYNLAGLTVLPSFYEGFGLPVLESLACGTPVVCSKVASLAEIAGPAIFCDPDSSVDIAKKITHVLSLSQRDSEKLSQKSIDHASKFTWHKVAQQTIEVYKSI